jgi:hypothetical protein
MIKEQDQNIPPSVIAARAKKGLALATGNPVDKIVVSPPEVEKKVHTEETLIERVVSMMQRRKRSLQMKRRKSKVTRARNVKRTRLATKEQLMNRARRMAKTMLRKRVAGARGANYSKLSPAQKMNIDRQVEAKAKNIGAMATKLMPRVKAGEMKRLSAVRSHKSTKGVYGNAPLNQSYEPVLYSKLLGERISKEDLNNMFSMYEGFVSSALAPVRVAAKAVRGAALTALAVQNPQSMNTAAAAGATMAINKLANIGKSTKKKVNKKKNIVSHKEWDYESYLHEKADQHLQKKAEKYGVTFEQVKQVFEQGLAEYEENEKNNPHQFAMQLVNSYLANLSENGLWDNIHAKQKRIKAGSGEHMRKPGSKGAPTKQNFVDAAESLEESFIVDRASGYSGVYTAKDLGIKMQGGFALHPSVEEDYGAGFEGTKQLTNKYKKDTPGEAVEAFARMMRAKRKANTPC